MTELSKKEWMEHQAILSMYHTMPYSSGTVWPQGIPIGQSWASVGAILTLIQEYEINTFIEIGIDRGGFSYLLSTRGKTVPGFRYYGIEKYPEKIHEYLTESEFFENIFIGDFFEESGKEWMREIVSESNGPLMVFCDGGNKPKEVKFVSETIESGFILAHDLGKEFQETDQPENTTRILHPWLPATSLYLMKKDNAND